MITFAHPDPIQQMAAAKALAAQRAHSDTTIHANEHDEFCASMRRMRFEGERKRAARPVAWPVRAYAIVMVFAMLAMLAAGVGLYRQLALVEHRVAVAARV